MSLLSLFTGEGLESPSIFRGQAVGDSEDLRRIVNLPRRPVPSAEEIQVWQTYFKAKLGKNAPKCECESRFHYPCCQDLLPTQAWALKEAHECGGLLGPIGVGHGKTLLDLLSPMVVKDCKSAVLLLPPNLKTQLLEKDIHYYGQHWNLPNIAGQRWVTPGRPTMHVMAFSELSSAKNTAKLEALRPDTIIVDEAHNLRNFTAARTERFLRYFKSFPETRLLAWSGTLTSRSIKDYAHLATLSLGVGSPVPSNWHALESWAAHLDPSEFRTPPGRLTTVLGKDTRAGFRKRLLETKGTVSSGDAASCTSELRISQLKIQTPVRISTMLNELEASWQRPDGEEFMDALSVDRCAQQLSAGFYYRWKFPRKEPKHVIEKWLEVRKCWHKEVREKLKKPVAHLDSPFLVEAAARRWFNGYTHIERDSEGKQVSKTVYEPFTSKGPLPVWDSLHYREWLKVRDTVKPETEAIWVDFFLVNACREWLQKSPGIVWYQFAAFGKEVAKGFTHAGPGEEGNLLLTRLTGGERVVASIKAHGTGKNLQMFSRNLVANPPKDGATFEQLLGRTHRTGQMKEVVEVDFYAHTPPLRSAMERAIELAGHIEGTFGAKQRLNHANWNS